MKASRAKLILSYVLPTILSQCAFFLFTIVDGIFVGRGVGTDALGGSQSCPAACYDHRRGIYVEMVCDYLFWYTAFTIPSALAATLQGFGRNDGAPVFVMVSTIVSTALNIFLDWLFVFPLKQGLAGADHRVLHEPCDHPVSAGGQCQRLLGHQLCGRLCLCRVYRRV